jgi:membrane protein DedA with SNARE-associated domain
MWIAIGLAAATLVSEDATAIGAGVLARNGEVSAATATLAVAAGIWMGDVGLFVLGRIARRWRPVARWVDRRWSAADLRARAARLDRGAPAAILLSRMVPGSRVPLYVAAGILPVRAAVFIVCTGVAAALWTTAIVAGLTWWRLRTSRTASWRPGGDGGAAAAPDERGSSGPPGPRMRPSCRGLPRSR